MAGPFDVLVSSVSGSSSPLEDGSTAYFDGKGNLTSIVDRDDKVWAPDTSVVSDFLKNATNTVGNALTDRIREAFAPKPQAAQATTVTRAGITPQQAMLFAGAAFAGWFFFVRKK